MNVECIHNKRILYQLYKSSLRLLPPNSTLQLFWKNKLLLQYWHLQPLRK